MGTRTGTHFILGAAVLFTVTASKYTTKSAHRGETFLDTRQYPCIVKRWSKEGEPVGDR